MFLPNYVTALEMNCINTRSENLPNISRNIKDYANIKNEFLGFIAKSKKFIRTCASLMNESTKFKCSGDTRRSECAAISSEIKRSCQTVYNQEQTQISQQFRFKP